ncbi:pseudouridine-5'-phosphatase [Scaptodrosophila lebanonensis]|uniref:Pseudouridine-5'-phosphatase n=1 Tax=Drosophila lebanonensis TaxID=7225 RepID=A0A6J2U748_DROLE|nr:pseudouridine-5'-phosphatase [Scaptodrosophila lebanonensis]
MCSKKPKTCKPPPCCLQCPPPCCSNCPPPCKYKPVSYCIFDLESAVFDERNVYQRACREVAQEYDCTVPDAVLMQSGPMLIGEMAELVCRKCNIPVPWEQFLLRVNERAIELISNPPFMAGVERLVRHLDKHCIGLALVTSCTEKLYKGKIQGHEEFFELFCHVMHIDDPELNQPKPAPDIYLLAMSRFCGDPSAGCVLVFDGKPKGIQAARDARMQSVMLPVSNLPCCWSELATLRLDTLEQFVPEEFGLPPYGTEQRRRSSHMRASRMLSIS